MGYTRLPDWSIIAGMRRTIVAAIAMTVIAAATAAAVSRPDAETTAAAAAADGPASRDAASPRREPMPPLGRGQLVGKVRAGAVVPVYDRPGGRLVGRVRHRTDFGSRTALAVFERRDGGRWAGVASTGRPDGRLGWVRADRGDLAWSRIDRSLHVDLSERHMQLREGRDVLIEAPVTVGRPATPTPTGRFGVTDRLAAGNYSRYYGCCIIAFTGVQPNLPPGWPGGNRIGLHGTLSPSSIGAPASAGCLRASDDVMRRLMTELPLGAPVHIRR